MQNSAVATEIIYYYLLLSILFSFKQKRALPCGKAHLI